MKIISLSKFFPTSVSFVVVWPGLLRAVESLQSKIASDDVASRLDVSTFKWLLLAWLGVVIGVLYCAGMGLTLAPYSSLIALGEPVEHYSINSGPL